MSQDLDPAALAALRPGASAADVNTLLTAAQRGTVRPGGLFHDEEIGFLVRIDIAGRIGSMTFARKFPQHLVIEGLQVGMTLAAARAARPTLHHDRDQSYGDVAIVHWTDELAAGLVLMANLHNGNILSIGIEKPGALYRKPPPRYPQPAGIPGAPFIDSNLKLVVLDALRESGVIDLGTPADLAQHLLGESFDRDSNTGERLQPVYDFLVRYPLGANELATVRSLTFDGGNEIYSYVVPHWDGEDGAFDVASLDGLAQLPNLTQINVVAMLSDMDLSRLAPLTRLTSISLDPGPYDHGETLLALPALQELYVFETSFEDPSITRRLTARGVTVRMWR